jgi:hypothetical protein
VRQSAGVFTAFEAKKQLVHIQHTERPESLCPGNHPLPLWTSPWHREGYLVPEASIKPFSAFSVTSEPTVLATALQGTRLIILLFVLGPSEDSILSVFPALLR